jgi:hypothetical protein
MSNLIKECLEVQGKQIKEARYSSAEEMKKEILDDIRGTVLRTSVYSHKLALIGNGIYTQIQNMLHSLNDEDIQKLEEQRYALKIELKHALDWVEKILKQFDDESDTARGLSAVQKQAKE